MTHCTKAHKGKVGGCPYCECDSLATRLADYDALLRSVPLPPKAITYERGVELLDQLQALAVKSASAPSQPTAAPEFDPQPLVLTDAECDYVVNFMDNHEWTGLSREDVRLWAKAFDDVPWLRSANNGSQPPDEYRPLCVHGRFRTDCPPCRDKRAADNGSQPSVIPCPHPEIAVVGVAGDRYCACCGVPIPNSTADNGPSQPSGGKSTIGDAGVDAFLDGLEGIVSRTSSQPEPVTCKHGQPEACALCAIEDREHDETMAADNGSVEGANVNEKLYRFHWRTGRPSEGWGRTLEDAFSRLGYGAGAAGALDYWEVVEPQSTPESVNDAREGEE